MTVRQLAEVLTRRWLMVGVGLACTALMMLWAIGRPGVYWTQVEVVFLAPSALSGNVLADNSDTLINFAGVVETRINGGEHPPRLSSSSATLYGSGVREGYSVTLPDAGGQWSNYFSRPVLAVEVVGASEDDVRQSLDEVLRRIEAEVDGLQSRAGAGSLSRIRTELSPGIPAVSYIAGSPRRGALAIGLLGSILTVASAATFDRWRSRQERRQLVLEPQESVAAN